VLALCLFPCSAFAGPFDDIGSSELTLPLYLELRGAWAYSSASGQTMVATTNLTSLEGGGTAGVLLGHAFILGVSSDYRYVTQSSALTADGNFSGSRWDVVAPTIGVKYGPFVLRAEYEFEGSFDFANTTSSGSNLSYVEPSGFRATLLYQIFPMVYGGAYYESVSFKKQLDSLSGETILSPAMSMTEFGLTAAIVF
jgi:hypothetical protein